MPISITPKTSANDFVAYFEYYADAKKSNYLCALKWLKQFNSSLPFNSIDEAWGEMFKAFLKSRLSNNTASVYFSKVKCILNLAVREGLIRYNPLHYVKLPLQEYHTDYLLPEEIERLRNLTIKGASMKKDVLRAFLFALETGLRMSDIMKLTEDNIQGSHIVVKQQKTGAIVRNKLNFRACEILEKGLFNLPKTKAGIIYHITNLFKQAGIKKHGKFHLSRHTFGVRLVEKGVSLTVIQDLLGHRDIQNTVRYTKATSKAKDNAIDLLD